MRFTVLLFTLKRLIKSPICWLFVIVIPIIYVLLVSLSKPLDEIYTSANNYSLAIVKNDADILSNTLENILKSSYNIISINKADINETLISEKADAVLIIPSGFTDNLLSGVTPSLEIEALETSAESVLIRINAENIIRSLRILAYKSEGDILSERLAQFEKSESIKINKSTEDDFSPAKNWLGLYSFLVLMTAYFCTKLMLEDKMSGMNTRLGCAPISPRRYMLQSIIAFSVPVFIQAVLTVTAMKYIGGYYMPSLHLIIIASMCFAFLSVGFSIMVVSLANNIQVAIGLIVPCTTIFSMLGGAYWPREFMPEFMQKVSYISPSFWYINALGSIQNNTDFIISILFMLGFTAAFLLLGSWKKFRV